MFNVLRSYEIAMSYLSERNYRLRLMSAGLTALIPEYLYSDHLNKHSRQSPHLLPPRARSMVVIKAYWTCTSATGPLRTSPNIYRLFIICAPLRRTPIFLHLNSKLYSFGWLRLNFLLIFNFCLHPRFGDDVRIIHFIGITKPWLQYFDTLTSTVQPPPGATHLQPLLQLWWNIFCEQVHPQLSPSMVSLINNSF